MRYEVTDSTIPDFNDAALDTDLLVFTSLRASNTDVSQKTSSGYISDDDCNFYGKLDPDTRQISVWHEVRRDEQTTDDQDIVRIEANNDRTLACIYRTGDSAIDQAFSIVLTGADFLCYSVLAAGSLAAVLY